MAEGLQKGRSVVKAGEAIVEILKREGVEIIFGYPVNHLLEEAAKVGIRPVICRQERIGLHMADAYSRLSSGDKIGVFAMQHGPGAENAFGGVAQAFGESVPILVMPMGYARRLANVQPNFSSVLNMKHVTKSAEPITSAAEIPDIMRRAFTALRHGRGGPVLVEAPTDIFAEELDGELDYKPVSGHRSGPDPEAIEGVAERLVGAKRLVIHAGQGVHYAKAWDELKTLAELLAAPVCTSLQGKSAFPEDHPLALGSGGNAVPKPVHRFLADADLIFGIGCSFTTSNFAVAMPEGKAIIHRHARSRRPQQECRGRGGAARRRQVDPRCADFGGRGHGDERAEEHRNPSGQPSKPSGNPGSTSGERSSRRIRRRSLPTG